MECNRRGVIHVSGEDLVELASVKGQGINVVVNSPDGDPDITVAPLITSQCSDFASIANGFVEDLVKTALEGCVSAKEYTASTRPHTSPILCQIASSPRPVPKHSNSGMLAVSVSVRVIHMMALTALARRGGPSSAWPLATCHILVPSFAMQCIVRSFYICRPSSLTATCDKTSVTRNSYTGNAASMCVNGTHQAIPPRRGYSRISAEEAHVSIGKSLVMMDGVDADGDDR